MLLELTTVAHETLYKGKIASIFDDIGTCHKERKLTNNSDFKLTSIMLLCRQLKVLLSPVFSMLRAF